MNYKMTPAQVKSAIREKLSHIYGVSAENASDDEFYKASALVVRDLLVRGRNEFVHEAEKQETKQIYYLCMEFLLGRSLKNNLFNFGLEDSFRKALSEMGVSSITFTNRSRTPALATAASAVLPHASLTALQHRATRPWAIPCAMNTVFPPEAR